MRGYGLRIRLKPGEKKGWFEEGKILWFSTVLTPEEEVPECKEVPCAKNFLFYASSLNPRMREVVYNTENRKELRRVERTFEG